MEKISAVIITFNEEKNIARCLQSLQGVVDEIVVVDSFSTDKTEEICGRFGVRFLKHAFEGHIQQKNWALEQATFSHVLSLDADEVLSDKLQQSILQIKSNWVSDAYSFNRLTNYCGKWVRHCGWYPDVKLRLWDKSKGCWGGTNPHDKVIMQQETKIQKIEGNLLHYSYYTVKDHISQIEKFTDISSKEVFARGKRTSIFGIIIKSQWKFIRDYFFKLGFLDGYYGFIICSISAFATFLKYIKVKEQYKLSHAIH